MTKVGRAAEGSMTKITKTLEEAKIERKAFKVSKIFAEWRVILSVEGNDNYDTLLKKAMQVINDKRVIPDHPEHDLVLEEM